MTGAGILHGAVLIAMALLSFGAVCAFIRMVRGPSHADRIVALDMVSMLLVGFAGVAAVAFDEAALLDAAITLALMGFLATVAFARYVERLRMRHDRSIVRKAGGDDG
jgi:multicomponent Na+:H+ antiporter subunit F